MSAEQRIRAAFADLEDRARREVDAGSALRRATGTRQRRFAPAVLAATAVFVLVGGFALLELLPGTTDERPPVIDAPSESIPTGSTAPEPPASTIEVPTGETTPESTTPASPETTVAVPTTPEAELHRVRTEAVRADVDDPFLNVRQAPDPSAPVVAKLAPTYAGVRYAGEARNPAGGGTWWLVDLVDPVTVEAPADDGNPPRGWVNAAFLEPLPSGVAATTDDVPACEGGDGGAGGGEAAGAAVSSLRAGWISGDCLRIVLGFATPPGDEVVLPASGVPSWVERQSNAPLVVSLPATTSAWTGAAGGDGWFLTREADGSLSLVVTGDVDGTHVSTVPERGLLVVDVVTGPDRAEPPGDDRVQLTGPVLVGPGSVAVRGLSRPFEANLGISILGSSGEPVEAVFSGSDFLGTVSATAYGVTTTDWAEAWGRWAVGVAGLEAGRYTMILDALGGEEAPEAFRLEFTITEEASEAAAPPVAASNDLGTAAYRAARSGDFSELPLDAGVVLGLGEDLGGARSASALAERDGWAVEAAGGEFAGRSGTFNPMDVLAGAVGVEVSEGPVAACAGLPRTWPSLAGLRQVNLEPVGIDSCIDWFAVSLFVGEDGSLAAVVLDLWEP